MRLITKQLQLVWLMVGDLTPFMQSRVISPFTRVPTPMHFLCDKFVLTIEHQIIA